jgi:RecG-like helicase
MLCESTAKHNKLNVTFTNNQATFLKQDIYTREIYTVLIYDLNTQTTKKEFWKLINEAVINSEKKLNQKKAEERLERELKNKTLFRKLEDAKKEIEGAEEIKNYHFFSNKLVEEIKNSE